MQDSPARESRDRSTGGQRTVRAANTVVPRLLSDSPSRSGVKGCVSCVTLVRCSPRMPSPPAGQPNDALRRWLLPWAIALLLPLPALLFKPGGEADVPLVYLGIGAAWFTAEAFRPGAAPASWSEWRTRMIGLAIGCGLNVGIFVTLGSTVGTKSAIPFGLLAALSVVPALGLVPWLTLRSGSPAGGILLAVTTVAALKLLACVLARVVYGPNFIERGYVAADWHTAKLMITTFWISTVAVSCLGAVATARRCAATNQPGKRVATDPS